jgi:Uncharacterized protein conserved in archaea
MRTDDLLHHLQNEAQSIDYSNKFEYVKTLYQENPSIVNRLALYNYESLEALKNYKLDDTCDIDDAIVTDMKSEMNDYLDAYLSENEEYKRIIKIVCLYLTFIAHKPLHPAGLFDTEGKYETLDGLVVCPLKKSEISKPGSLCKYCSSTMTKG